mmetsp:Transcript_13063/g.17863  ORF Transcript_13063/g.17863 Transcript_13063/m.17863 type:complete len:258 (+) Transcript_13063:1155-1928(+)
MPTPPGCKSAAPPTCGRTPPGRAPALALQFSRFAVTSPHTAPFTRNALPYFFTQASYSLEIDSHVSLGARSVAAGSILVANFGGDSTGGLSSSLILVKAAPTAETVVSWSMAARKFGFGCCCWVEVSEVAAPTAASGPLVVDVESIEARDELCCVASLPPVVLPATAFPPGVLWRGANIQFSSEASSRCRLVLVAFVPLVMLTAFFGFSSPGQMMFPTGAVMSGAFSLSCFVGFSSASSFLGLPSRGSLFKTVSEVV